MEKWERIYKIILGTLRVFWMGTNGKTYEDFAKALNVSKAKISRIENSKETTIRDLRDYIKLVGGGEIIIKFKNEDLPDVIDKI